MKDEEILKLYRRVYRFLVHKQWTKPEIDDLQSYMIVRLLEKTIDKRNTFRYVYYKALRDLFPIQQEDIDLIENHPDKIAYDCDFDTKIQVEEIICKIPSKDRVCVLKFMYERDKSSNSGLEMRRRRIFTEIREREEDVL